MSDVRPFVEDREWAADALATVLARAEAGDGTVRWADVRGDLEASRWGALVERGLLVDGGGAFVVDDPVAVRAALDDAGVEVPAPREGTAEEATGPDGRAAADGVDDAGWSTADGVAAVCALALVSGYQVVAIRNAVGAGVDALLGPVEAVVPFPLLVLGLALATTGGSVLLRRRLLGEDPGTERAAELREEIAAARERGDEAAVRELAAEQQRLLVSTATLQLRPLAWTLLLTVPVFLWLYWVTLSPTRAVAPAVTVLPHLGEVVWTARVVGPLRAWMVWYAACSLSTNMAVRRLLGRVAGS